MTSPDARAEATAVSCACRFDGGEATTVLARRLWSFSLAYRSLLPAIETSVGTDKLRMRPAPHVWSVLEYVAHVRDAVAWYDHRISRVLAVDRPRLSPFDFDAACEERRYADEDPADVTDAVGTVIGTLADRLDSLDDASWSAIGIGSDGTERRVVDLARRAAHECQHHLRDIGGIWNALDHGERIEPRWSDG
jgi:hypothetical protein